MRGTVKFYSRSKGFGYIGPDDRSPDVKVTRAVVQEFLDGELDPGDRVDFEVTQNRDGPIRAISLTKVFGRPSPQRSREMR